MQEKHILIFSSYPPGIWVPFKDIRHVVHCEKEGSIEIFTHCALYIERYPVDELNHSLGRFQNIIEMIQNRRIVVSKLKNLGKKNDK